MMRSQFVVQYTEVFTVGATSIEKSLVTETIVEYEEPAVPATWTDALLDEMSRFLDDEDDLTPAGQLMRLQDIADRFCGGDLWQLKRMWKELTS